MQLTCAIINGTPRQRTNGTSSVVASAKRGVGVKVVVRGRAGAPRDVHAVYALKHPGP
jgi:hypothetical protein